MLHFSLRLFRYLLALVLFLSLAYGALVVFVRPSLNRDWSPDEVVLARAEISSTTATITNIRNIDYRTTGDYDSHLYDKKLDLNNANMQKLFISMLTRANKLATEPEFYNTLTNTCTTNIVVHVNEIAPGRIPFSYKVLMPGYSDELARQVGLIDNTLSIEELRAKYRINDRALKYADDPHFSERIRDLNLLK